MIPHEEDISVAILYPGNRVDKLLVPLKATDMEIAVEPTRPYCYDIVLVDNADRKLIVPVVRGKFSRAKVVYRMRGDLYRELELWDMHEVKKWLAINVVVANVDGVVAANSLLAEKAYEVSGVSCVGTAGIAKDPDYWPLVSHTGTWLNAITLTNANYPRKVEPLLRYAPTVERLFSASGGHWSIYASKGRCSDRLRDELADYEHVTFEGYTKEPKAALRRSNIMFHFSSLDAMPNAILEGMASGMPVVTTDFEAFTAYQGPIHRIRNRSDLACVTRAARSPTWRADWGLRGREHVRRAHAPEVIGQQYVEFFKRVLA